MPADDLAAKCLIGTEKKLLSGLSARVKRSRDLRSAERAIRQQSTVFAREWHTLLDAVIDDQITDLREAIYVRFA